MRNTLLALTLAFSLIGNAAAAKPLKFNANLFGFNAGGVPIATTAQGRATVEVIDDGTALNFTVKVAGIDNLLVFTEDYRLTGDSLQEMMFFHVDAGKLDSVLEHIRQGETVEGDSLKSNVDFLLGSGVESSWGKNVPDLEMKEMEEMTKIGTGYFLTTPVFDVDQFARFLKQAQTFGVPVIAEVMILRTAGMARFLNRHLRSGLVPEWIIEKLARAPDKQKASVEIFTDIVTGLKDLCQGVHIITIGGEEKLKHYLDAAKLK